MECCGHACDFEVPSAMIGPLSITICRGYAPTNLAFRCKVFIEGQKIVNDCMRVIRSHWQ